MKKEIVFEILEHLFVFDASYKDSKDYTLNDFVGYLTAETSANAVELRDDRGDKELHLKELRRESNSDVSVLITLMFRYAKGYIKKALHNSLIQTVDEFAFLITLMTFDSLTKTELINKQVMEKTSGIEVIKRLLSQKLIKEFADENDKRSVRVTITLKGKKEITSVLPEMANVSRVVVGNLSKAEINTLSYLLKKLDYFHNDIFINKKALTLNEILSESSHN
jgi:DNA-binding MarR family transcriptional regulator